MPDGRPTLLSLLVAGDERTQEEIVAGFEQWARDNGEDATLSLRTLRRWMIGDVRTKPRPAQRRVARAYWGYSMDELLAPPAAPLEPPASGATATAAATATATAATAAAVRSRDGLAGHEAHATGVAPTDPVSYEPPAPVPAVLDEQVASSTRRATRFTSYAESRNVGPEAIATLADEVGGLAGDYVREPVARVLGELIEAQETVFSLLEARQRPPEARHLYVLAGVVSGMIAKASHDLNRPHDAMTHARTMFVCAENADHLGLRAWARGLQSLIAFWAGRMHEAVRYAEAGAMFTSGLRGSVTVWLPALEARASAQLGQRDDARDAIDRARKRREVVVPDELDRMGGLLAFPVAKQHYYAAGAYVCLDDTGDEAEQEAERALELYRDRDAPEWSFSDQAGAHAELALARVHAGEVEGAREALAPVLLLEPSRRIWGVVTSVRRVQRALGDGPAAAAQATAGLRDEIEAFCQVAAALAAT